LYFFRPSGWDNEKKIEILNNHIQVFDPKSEFSDIIKSQTITKVTNTLYMFYPTNQLCELKHLQYCNFVLAVKCFLLHTLAAGHNTVVQYSTAWYTYFYGIVPSWSVPNWANMALLIQSYWLGTVQHSKLNPSVSLVVELDYW